MDKFVFIPQTGSSKKSSDHRVLVRAHVTRRNWEKANDQATPDVQSTGDATPHAASSICSPAHNDSSTSSHTLNVRKSSPGKDASSPHAAQRKLKTQHVPAKVYQSIGRSSDALIYAGSFLDADSYGLLHHYGSEFKVIFCDPIQPIRIDGPTTCCTQAIQMRSPALLHAICFQAAGHVAVRQASLPLRQDMFKDPNHSHGLERRALYHKAEALRDLRSSLHANDGAGTALETSVLCVAVLLAAEFMMGDTVGLQSHAYGLGRLVAACGGVDRLSASTASLVRLVDVKASIALRRAPYFEMKSCLREEAQSFLQLSISQPTDDDDLPNFGLGFLKPSLLSRLNPALLRCVSRIKCLTLDSSRMSKGCQNTATCTIDNFVAVEHSILSLGKHYELSALEECVCLALLLFTNTALWRIPLFFNLIQYPVAELKDKLLLLDLEKNLEGCSELFLWIVLMGCHTTRTRPASVERDWWSGRLRELATRSDLTTFQEVEPIVSTFAYVDEIYNMSWEQIWNEAMFGCLQGHQAASSEADRPDYNTEDHPCIYH